MIEIIVDEKTAREKLFDTYYSKDIKSNSIITPKNNEIRKYCEFLKKYYYPFHNKEIDYLDEFFVMKIDEEHYEKTNYSCIEDNEIFLFEFPDDYPEEDLFYFKLKYC